MLNSISPFMPTNCHQYAPSASGGTMTAQIASPAICPPYGTTPAPPTAPTTSKAICSTRAGEPSARTSSAPEDAQARATTMNAQGAVTPPMELRNAPVVSTLWARPQSRALTVTVLFPHHSILLFTHTHCLLTWRGRRHYTNTSFLFIRTLSSFCFFDLSMDLANS